MDFTQVEKLTPVPEDESLDIISQALSDLITRIKASPAAQSKPSLLAEMESFKGSWEAFVKNKDEYTPLTRPDEKFTSDLIAKAHKELDALEATETETAEHQESIFAGIYARIASFFKELIELFQQYVSEPIQNAARSTASFFSRPPVATTDSYDPCAEEDSASELSHR